MLAKLFAQPVVKGITGYLKAELKAAAISLACNIATKGIELLKSKLGN